MRTFILILTAILFSGNIASANDGVYFTSGSFLIPIKETDISAKNEILTITICKDGYADVDVDYTFFNNSHETKVVTMAFEAQSPYNTCETLHRDGKHPFITHFSVQMNGSPLSHRNAIVALRLDETDHWQSDHQPLDMSQWKGIGEVPDSIIPFEDALYNEALDSAICFAYAYYFDATFTPGENKVHHTYRYKMSSSIGCRFSIPYWLTPVTRWANGQVDDFTLRINTQEQMSEDILLSDTLFKASHFSLQPEGSNLYHINRKYEGSSIFATIDSGHTLVWHTTNFSPKANLQIESADALAYGILREYAIEGDVVIDKDGNTYRYLADTDNGYFVSAQDYGIVPGEGAHVEPYHAEDGQGWLVLNGETKAANVRMSPTKKSKVLCVIKAAEEGCLPEVYPCLGLVRERHSNGDLKEWFKIKVGKRIGYVSRSLMIWDSINPY